MRKILVLVVFPVSALVFGVVGTRLYDRDHMEFLRDQLRTAYQTVGTNTVEELYTQVTDDPPLYVRIKHTDGYEGRVVVELHYPRGEVLHRATLYWNGEQWRRL